MNDSEITQQKEENRRLANRLKEIDENLTIIKTERDQLQTRNDTLSAELEAIREQLDNAEINQKIRCIKLKIFKFFLIFARSIKKDRT